MIDIWKPVKGYEGFYEVSSTGKVKSIPRTIMRKDGKPYRVKKERLMKLYVDEDGYHRVELQNAGSAFKTFAHRLVAQSFIPNPKNKPQVNHINGIKDDNRVENLEWVTLQENRDHAVANGLVADQRGMKNPANTLNEKQVLKIVKLKKEGFQPAEIARKIDIPHSNVRNVYYGYTWAWLTGGVC